MLNEYDRWQILFKQFIFRQTEMDIMVQFPDPETERKLLLLGPEIVKGVQQDIWAHKLTKWCNFWTQKLEESYYLVPEIVKWFSKISGPRN